MDKVSEGSELDVGGGKGKKLLEAKRKEVEESVNGKEEKSLIPARYSRC